LQVNIFPYTGIVKALIFFSFLANKNGKENFKIKIRSLYHLSGEEKERGVRLSTG